MTLIAFRASETLSTSLRRVAAEGGLPISEVIREALHARPDVAAMLKRTRTSNEEG